MRQNEQQEPSKPGVFYLEECKPHRLHPGISTVNMGKPFVNI